MWWDVYCKWWTHDRTDYHWKFVCRCFDVEALGVVERALQSAGQEIKTEQVSPVPMRHPDLSRLD